MEEAQLKSSERLEELMHLVADRVMGLTTQLDHFPNPQEEVLVASNGINPAVRQAEDNLMAKQLQIQHQMALIQTGVQALSGWILFLVSVAMIPYSLKLQRILLTVEFNVTHD